MVIKKLGIILFTISIIVILIIHFYSNVLKKEEKILTTPETTLEENIYKSNIIKDVKYQTKDQQGNEYIIDALLGEIDFSNSNIIYLTDVNALIKLKNKNNVYIKSDYGKYNSENFNTIFSKNVTIDYLENQIIGEYLDFSFERNSMIISRDVIYTNPENTLKADVIEVDIKSKDTKIFMFDNQKKVNIKSKN
tara:strand:+ start:4 stop:582 length:579 start_codon:yes stop_codon:yes gene_type:complete